MITLHDKDAGVALGTITEEDLAVILNSLEEESRTDTDYYVQAGTIDLLEADGASAELVALLRSALGSKPGIEVEWTRE